MQAMIATLKERGEPVTYLQLHAAGLAAMAEEHTLRLRSEALPQINALIQAALAGPGFVHHGEGKNPETGLWALEEWEPGTESLPDRVEGIVVRYLLKYPGTTMRELETAVNAELPGLMTPSLGLLRAVISSYTEETDGRLVLREEDQPSSRRADLESAAQALTTLGTRLGYTLERRESPQRLILWKEANQPVFAFYLLASSMAGKILRQNPFAKDLSILVVPGGRAGLLAYKLAP